MAIVLSGEFAIVKDDLTRGVDQRIWRAVASEISKKPEEEVKKVMRMRGNSTVYQKTKLILNCQNNKPMFPMLANDQTPFDQQNITSGSLLKFANFSEEYKGVEIASIGVG